MLTTVSKPFINSQIKKSTSSMTSKAMSTSSPKSHLPETMLRVVIPLAVGVLSSNILPTYIPQLVTDMLFAGLATYTSQPIVNAKLGSQTEVRPVVVYDSKIKAPFLFLAEDTQSFVKNFKHVVENEGACNGVAAYAAKNAMSKALTMFGVDTVKPIVDIYCTSVPSELKTVAAGMISGILQSPITGPLEWSSSLHSKRPEMSYKNQAEFMVDYMKTKNRLPITAVTARSGIFDAAFNTLHHEYGLPFGPSSIMATTLSYPAEIKRAQYQTDIETLRASEKSESREEDGNRRNVFQGWVGRTIEMMTIFTLFQLLRNQLNDRKKSESVESGFAVSKQVQALE